MKEQEFLAAVPALEADERTRMIEDKPYHIVSFEKEANRDSFINDIKEKMGLTARPVQEEPIEEHEFLAAVPAPCETDDTVEIEGAPYLIFGFDNEYQRDNFINDVKEQQDVVARPVTRTTIQ